MNVGDHVRELRKQKNLSQGDIETRTGLLRCYISRVENGYTVPSIQTLEKIARAFDVPLYQLFYEGNEKPSLPVFFKPKKELVLGSSSKEARMLGLFSRCLSRLHDDERELLLYLARKMERRLLFVLRFSFGSVVPEILQLWRITEIGMLLPTPRLNRFNLSSARYQRQSGRRKNEPAVRMRIRGEGPAQPTVSGKLAGGSSTAIEKDRDNLCDLFNLRRNMPRTA